MQDNQHSAMPPPWTPLQRTGQVVQSLNNAFPDGLVFENSRYIVVVRDCGATDIGKLLWLSVKRLDNRHEQDWRDLQRIKNELVGEEAEAVQLYPAESRLVDTANQAHLWAFPGYQFPFGFWERLFAEGTQGVSQRPFAPDNRPPDLSCVHLAGLGFTLLQGGKDEGASTTQAEGRFALGQVVATPGAIEAFNKAGQNAAEVLQRHWNADWGDVPAEDKRANDRALRENTRLLSAYTLSNDVKVWIITEADRSATTLLLPSEY